MINCAGADCQFSGRGWNGRSAKGIEATHVAVQIGCQWLCLYSYQQWTRCPSSQLAPCNQIIRKLMPAILNWHYIWIWILLQHGDILKPNYNSVDFMEMELVDSNGTFRNNDSSLLHVRYHAHASELIIAALKINFVQQMRHEMVMKDKSFRNLRIRVPQDDFVNSNSKLISRIKN